MLVPQAVPIADPQYKQRFLQELHSRISLHPRQIEIARRVEAGQHIMVSCGRKFGKSTLAQYLAIRKAVLYKNCYIYIVAPYAKQVKEIYWEQELVTRLCPPQYIERIDRQSMRFKFKTGSFIKFDGADNPELHRGPAVHFFIGDEFKDFDPRLLPAMEPNLLTTKGQFCAFGTPPDEEITPKSKIWFGLVQRAKTEPNWDYFIGDSEDNPHNDPVELGKIRDRLIANGDEDVWYREYKGIYVPRESAFIFPMFDNQRRYSQNIFSDDHLSQELYGRHARLEWWAISDPGTKSCFAQLYVGYDKKSGEVYCLHEEYVTKQEEATALKMLDRERAAIRKLYPRPDDWNLVYDEREAWYYNERVALGAAYRLQATRKNLWKGSSEELKPGLSLIKEAMRHGKLKVSASCKHLINELKSYSINKKGNIDKRNDHLIDCLRYFFLMSNYALPEALYLEKTPEAVKVLNQKKSQAVDLDRMLESDISEYMLAEALEWGYEEDY